MKLFRVAASMTVYLETEIEAETLSEAQEMAERMDGSDFEQLPGGDWELDDIFEVKP